jgi:AcrR family transcriptional regulator
VKQNTASKRIATEIRRRIRAGELAPGDRAPSARSIVREWQVALATATKVLAHLKREGLVRAKPGVGTIVLGERGPELSLERIVDTAIAIADEEGTDGLTMRSLAKELGVATMSLYRYVRSREDLLTMMADAVLAEDSPPPRERRTWRAQLELLLLRQWAAYCRHPWIAHQLSMTRPQALRHGTLHTESILEALADLRLDPMTTLRSGVTLLAYVRGMASALEQERAAERDTGQGVAEWVASRQDELAPLVEELPHLGRLSAGANGDMGLTALFECGLGILLDGLEARARRR